MACFTSDPTTCSGPKENIFTDSRFSSTKSRQVFKEENHLHFRSNCSHTTLLLNQNTKMITPESARFTAIYWLSAQLALSSVRCSHHTAPSASRLLLSECQVTVILPRFQRGSTASCSCYLHDIASSSADHPHTIIQPGVNTLATYRRFSVHSRLPGSTVTRPLVKHSDRCFTFLFAVKKHDMILSRSIAMSYGHPAEDNYIFAGTENIINEFVNIPSNRKILSSIKFKFVAALTYAGKTCYRSFNSFGLYSSGMRVNFELLISKNGSAGNTEIIRKPPAPGLVKNYKTRIINGVHLKGSTFVAPYMLRLNSAGEPSGGMYHVMFQTVSRYYNFTYDLYAVPGRATGQMFVNGTWTDLMADILYNGKDFIGLTSPEESRHGLIDMTSYKFAASLVFYGRRPLTHISWASITYPFTPAVWLFLFIAFVVIVTVIYCEQLLSKSVSGILDSEPLFNAFMIPFTALVDQDHGIPRSARTISMIWLLSVLVLGTAYKEQLFGYLTYPQPESTPQTFKQLHRQKNYRIFFHYLASTPSIYFEHTENPWHRALASRFERIPNGQECMMKVVLVENSVCMGLHNQLGAALASNLSINEHFQTLVVSREKLLPIFAAFGLPLHSVYTAAFDLFAVATRESGLLDKWYFESFAHLRKHGRLWLTETMKDSHLYRNILRFESEAVRNVEPLKLYHFGVCFGLLTTGLVVAVVSFAVERLRPLGPIGAEPRIRPEWVAS